MVSKPIRMIKGKEEVNRPRKPKKCNKPMGTIRDKEEVNGSRKSKK